VLDLGHLAVAALEAMLSKKVFEKIS